MHAIELEEVLAKLRGNRKTGLSAEEVSSRQKEYGRNALPPPKQRGLFSIFISQFKNPLIYLLLAAVVLTLIIGQISDPIVILVVLIINALMGTIQEGRAERSLSALSKMMKVTSKVIRNGEQIEVESSELVPGDLLVLGAGDAVGADARILESAQLRVDQSMLTGESAAVDKDAGIVREETAVPERSNMLYSGTHVIGGKALAIVTATGEKSQLGEISRLTAGAKPPPTPIEQRIDRLGKRYGIAAIVMFFVLVGVGIWRGLPFSDIVLAAVSQMVSLVPEGLPVAITIALAVGVQQMAKRRAIVRKLVAVETLGSTTVICTDKTGTVTKNEMTVTDIISDRREELLQAMILCNDGHEPMEVALLKAAEKEGAESDLPRTGELPFDASTKMMATAHGDTIFLKGAMEAILPLCSMEEVEEAQRLAGEGKRILAFARIDGGSLEKLEGATYLGFVALEDPLRDEVREAVGLCRSAGVRPILITGDHRVTAEAIAKQMGIEGRTIDGKDLEKMSVEELTLMVRDVAVFSRILPEQKSKIVEALQRNGEIVGMTGDGVNDAPALAKAHIGIAMGKTGTDVAKQASKMIITDDNFATIVHAVEQGRVIFNNIRKVLFYLLSTSLPAVFLMFLGVSLGYPIPLAAVQILWINVVTEGVVTINLILDPPEGDEMQTPPDKFTKRIFPLKTFWRMGFLILVIGGILIGFFMIRASFNPTVTQLQTETFTLLAICAWFNILNCKSAKKSIFKVPFFKNRYLAIGLLIGITLQIIVLYTPFFNEVFHTTPLSALTFLLLIGLGSFTLWAEEARKLFFKKR